MTQQSIETPEQLNVVIAALQKEVADLTAQRDELAKPSGGKMLKMFGISKEEAIQKLEEQIEEKQEQIKQLSAILPE